MFNKAKSHGFTLAEVLITLGIIGVVAALTLPNLIANYQKMVWATQLKKTVSTLEQGFQKLLADEGVDRLIDIDEIKKESGCCETGDGEIWCKDMLNLLNKYFNWNYENIDSDDDQVINLNDGSQISNFEFHLGDDYTELSNQECEKAKALGGNMCSELAPTIEIDVNGKKSPNESGKDRFTFAMSGEGKLYPYKGKDWAIFNHQEAITTNTFYWKNDKNYGSCPPKQNPTAWDNGCAARVVENGWKIDY